MAESRDNQPKGRMLFTDFDASDKGRPTGERRHMRDGSFPERRARRFPTLDALASSLDFGFEDDEVEPAFPPFAGKKAAIGKRTRAAEENGGKTDGEIASPAPGETETRAGGAASETLPRRQPPTWDWYASSFLKPSPERQREKEDSPERLFVRPERESEDRTSSAWHEHAGMDDDVDGDVDILSLLPPGGEDDEDAVHKPFEGEWRGQRLGVAPPRERPYGGITRLEEWYRPPEGTSERSVGPVADWYEPPKEEDASRDRDREMTERFAGEEDRPRNRDENSGLAASRSTRRFASGEGADTTRHIDIFSDIDLDSLWDEKIKSKQSDYVDGGTSSRKSTHLDDREPDGTREGKQAETPEELAKKNTTVEGTVILDPEIYDNASTIILSPEQMQRQATAPREERRIAVNPPVEPAGESATVVPEKDGDKESDALFDGLDKLLGDASSEDAPEPKVRSRAGASDASPDDRAGTSDTLDLDQLIALTDTAAPVVNNTVAAPVIGDADITDLRRKKRKASETDSDTVDLVGRETTSDSESETHPDLEESYIPSDAMVADAPAATSSTGEKPPAEEERWTAVDPVDVFANMDDMDFSAEDGLDDEMKAMLQDGENDAGEDEAINGETADAADVIDATAGAPPSEIRSGIFFFVKKTLGRAIPKKLLERTGVMLAWKENWWFYFDLLAAIVASASLAIIISYFVWYKN